MITTTRKGVRSIEVTNCRRPVVAPELVATLPEMVRFMEEPLDPFAFGIYSAARLAARHVKVVLGGDGGDEMFAGYDRYVGNQLVDLYSKPLVNG